MNPVLVLVLLLWLDLVLPRKIISPHNPTLRRFSNQPKVWLENCGVLNEYQSDPLDYDPRFKTQHVFENEFISKNGSDYIIFDRVVDVVFACQAKYPVKWTVPFPEQMLRISSHELSTTDLRSSISTSLRLPQNRHFVTLLDLTITQWTFLSANITCESVDNQHDRKTSIYVFTRGDWAIENEGKTIKVPLDYRRPAKDDNFILPCRPASPHLGVILEKQGPDKTYAEIKAPPKYLSFDPKVGFTMSNRLLGSQSFGLYRCRVNETNVDMDDKAGMVHINVTSNDYGPVREESMKEFDVILRKEGNATIYQAGKYLWCCSGVQGKHPQTLNELCNDATQCDLMKSIILEKAKNLEEFGSFDEFQSDPVPPERDDCSVIYLATMWTSSLVHCKGGNLHFQQHYTYAFEPNMQNIEERLQIKNTTEEKYFLSLVTADVLHDLPVERKVFISVGQVETPEYVGYDRYEPRKFQHFSGFQNWHFFENSYPIVWHSIGVWEFDRNYYYTGERIIVACLSLPLLYSTGAQFRMNYKDGTFASLARVNHESVYWYFEGGHFFNTGQGEVSINHCLSHEFTVKLEMESVECYVPKWNSTDWDVLKYELDVRPAVLPEVEVDSESVYFQLMEEYAMISFKVKGGLPAPRIIHIFKDGKLIEGGLITKNAYNEIKLQLENFEEFYLYNTFKMDVNVTIEEKIMKASDEKNITFYSVSLIFPNATHEIQGIYSCTVENVKGNVTQEIHVYVTARRGNMFVTILLSCTVVLGLFLVGIGIWYKFQHKMVQTLRFGIRRL